MRKEKDRREGRVSKKDRVFRQQEPEYPVRLMGPDQSGFRLRRFGYIITVTFRTVELAGYAIFLDATEVGG